MATIYELKKRAKELAAVSETNTVDPARVGNLIDDTLELIDEYDKNVVSLGIRKTYATVAAMEADKASPSGDDGKKLRFGQLVSVYDAGNVEAVDSGKVFAFQNPGWKLSSRVDAGYVRSEKVAELESCLFRNFTTNPIISEMKSNIAGSTNISISAYPIIANKILTIEGYLPFIYIESYAAGDADVYTFKMVDNVISEFTKIALLHVTKGNNVYVFSEPIKISSNCYIGLKNIGVIGAGADNLKPLLVHSFIGINMDGSYKSTINNFLAYYSAYVFDFSFATYISKNRTLIESLDLSGDMGVVNLPTYGEINFDNNIAPQHNLWSVSFNYIPIKINGYIYGCRCGAHTRTEQAQIIPFTCNYDGITTVSNYREFDTISLDDYVNAHEYFLFSEPIKVNQGDFFGIKMSGCGKIGKVAEGNYNTIVGLTDSGGFLRKLDSFILQEDLLLFSELKAIHQVSLGNIASIKRLNQSIEDVKVNRKRNIKLATSHPEILSYISSFLGKMNNRQLGNNNKPIGVNIVGLGDSIWGLVNYNSQVTNPQKMPPCMTALNLITRIYNSIDRYKPEYFRYDSGVFSETGSFKTVSKKGDGYDDWYDMGGGAVDTRVGDSLNCSIQFTPGYDYFSFIDRTVLNKGKECLVSVESGKLEVYNGATWVEANGYTLSQSQEYGVDKSNTTYQRRTDFRKVNNAKGTSFIVTITTKESLLMYWGIECYDRNFIRFVNIGHGGRTIDRFKEYITNELYERLPDFVLCEIPLLNMIPTLISPSMLDDTLDNFIFGDERNNTAKNPNALFLKSEQWSIFQVVFVIPNFAQDYYSGNIETTAPKGLYKRMDYYRHTLSYMHRNNLPFIDISQAMLNHIYKDDTFDTIGKYVSGSGVNGKTFLNEGIHPNDLGAEFMANEIDFLNS